MEPIIIHFYPDVDPKNLPGTVSEIGWQRLHDHLESAFKIRDGEMLVGITVTQAGIKGHFDFKPQTPNHE
jgi:hypothetical protein